MKKTELEKINHLLEVHRHKLPIKTESILRKLRRKLIKEITTGVISTGDEMQAQKLARKGLNVRLTKPGTTALSTSTGTLAEAGITFNSEETKAIAKEVGKSLANALRETGEELSKMTIKNVEENAFDLRTIFKNNIDKEYKFYMKEDKLFLADESGDKELVEVGVQPSGEALVNKDVLKNELLKYFKSLNELENMSYAMLESYVLDRYREVLIEAEQQAGIPGIAEPAPIDLAADTPPLKDTTETILEKFPTLKQILEKLMTRDFKDFVSEIDWISPRPTAFRINLQNGQDFDLKWTGKGFEAQIKGKKYFLNKIDEYQQALDKLNILYTEGPTGTGEEEGSLGSQFGGEDKTPPPSSFGGSAPAPAPAPGGEEAPAPEAPAGEATPEFGAETPAGEEAPSKDLGAEKVNFEEPEEEPKK